MTGNADNNQFAAGIVTKKQTILILKTHSGRIRRRIRMTTHNVSVVAIVGLIAIGSPLAAQNITAPPGYAELAQLPVPVVDGDITDRPYRVIGEIETGVRRATVFSKDPSRAKVYRELWERGKKLEADAVIKAEFGDAKIRALSWGSREARGTAVKFLTDDEIAALNPKPRSCR